MSYPRNNPRLSRPYLQLLEFKALLSQPVHLFLSLGYYIGAGQRLGQDST